MLSHAEFDSSEFVRTSLAHLIAQIDAGEISGDCLVLDARRSYAPGLPQPDFTEISREIDRSGYVLVWNEQMERVGSDFFLRPVLCVSRDRLDEPTKTAFVARAWKRFELGE